MDYGFKKLSDVDVVETPNESAHVLIEENGVIKKAPKDEVGGIRVKSEAEVGQILVVKAVDENGKPTEWETKFLSDIVLAKNIIIDRTNRTISFGKYTSSVFNYDGAEDIYSIQDPGLYEAVKELASMGCGVVLKTFTSYGETKYSHISADVKLDEGIGRIIVADFYIRK